MSRPEAQHLAAMRAAVVDWLTDAGLEQHDPGLVLGGLAQRLNAGGVAVGRLTLGSDLLHPVLNSKGYRWSRATGVDRVEFLHGAFDDNDDWARSPFFYMLKRDLDTLRRRLDGDYERGEFPVTDQLQDTGFTDYLAFKTTFGEAVRFGAQIGTIVSYACDRPGGFDPAETELLGGLARSLSLAFKAIDAHDTARTLLQVYLGGDPARRILAGDIVRGRAEPVAAVLWYSDLVGFTRIADSTGRDELLDLLNDYSEALVETLRAHGGEVLKFLGDGILARFAFGSSCGQALDAAMAAFARIKALNDRRAAEGRPVTGIHLALHTGEVFYGNIGSPDRLDFTVVGPAVNELARIEAMCRSLDQCVLVSSAFAQGAGEARSRLVSLGRYALRGVQRPSELFTLDPQPVTCAP